MLYKNKISKKTNNEKYVICEINTPINFLGQKIRKDYIECIYEKIDASNNVFLGMILFAKKILQSVKNLNLNIVQKTLREKLFMIANYMILHVKRLKLFLFLILEKRLLFNY